MLHRLAFAAAVAVLVPSFAGCGTTRLALSQVPQGVSRQSLDDETVIVFRRERSVRVFIADVHHLEGEEKAVVWCPNERLLVATTHGEAFDEDGVVVGGPTGFGLDEVPVTFERGYLVQAGPVKRGAKSTVTKLAFDTDGRWDAGPGSFCEGMQHL